MAERAAVLLQARVRGWLARRAYRRVKAAVVLLQCCVRRRAARKELLTLKAEARSVEKYRELNKGMEVKLMQLQLRADHQVGARRRLKLPENSLPRRHLIKLITSCNSGGAGILNIFSVFRCNDYTATNTKCIWIVLSNDCTLLRTEKG